VADDQEGRGRPNVPPLLATVADYCWRLIVVGVVLYALLKLAGRLHIVVLPVAIALLLCALLNPVTERLRKAGLPSLAATWLTMLLALGVLGGVGTWVGIRANDETPRLLTEVQNTSKQVQHWLVNGPLHLKNSQLQSWTNSATKYLENRRGELAGTAVQAGTVVAEVAAGIVFLFFVTFFLLKDGALIWSWLIGGTGRYRERVDRAGRAAWQTLSQYIHGTVMVAAIHAVIIALTLWILGVPLLAPLAVLVFFGSFIPIVGILVAGGVAVLVTFGTRGWGPGLIFLAVLIIEQQLEGHVLQPFVVGRWVRLHPLAVIMAITVGGVVGGITGAAFAVPTTAVVFRAWPALRGTDEETPAEDPGAPPPRQPVSNDSERQDPDDDDSVPDGPVTDVAGRDT
jgi:predicted PurR-regulated permease PerM